ncbi:hypothetical protein Ancab_029828 [Ancistrocladus abbreviatus]
MAVVTGDRYLESLVKFVDKNAGALIEGSLVLKVNPVGLHYVQSRLEALNELERLISGAPVDYLRSYIADLGDHRALEQLRRILCRLTSLKVVSVLTPPARDPTPLSLLPFGRLKVLELRGCDLSTSAAKGLLELRHTLEKLICYNSTDALRHVFASRIAEIKDSPQWNRLSFVSCASNGLLLTDESLQLLPAVETLDLSRNKFAKVDNLRKCTKLAHLDLGFNQLRSVASFGEFSCHILKLVLRNNALTTIRGIDNIKSLEGLDLSYNIISNFLELEVLSGLPSLQNLWLEGNPLSCARWYRPQVFSFFPFPDKLKLDGKEISAKVFWKRQIIIARRQKRPASYGFYSPIRAVEEEGHANMKRKKLSRLACIENEELSSYSDHGSVSCDNETHGGNESIVSNDETEVVGLKNKIEFMKKERSILWLRDFKDWMDQGFENVVDGSKSAGAILGPYGGNYLKASCRDIGESSRYTSDSVHAAGDSGTNILESDSSFTDFLTSFYAHQFVDAPAETISPFFLEAALGKSEPGPVSEDLEHLNHHLFSRSIHQSVTDYNSDTDVFATNRGDRIYTSVSATPLTVISDIMESQSSSACHGSPPHYQEDILHRRHYLEEEFLQLSAESFSVTCSDSNTSSSEDEKCASIPVSSHVEKTLGEEVVGVDIDGHSVLFVERSNGTHEFPEARQNGQCCLDLQSEQTSCRETHSEEVATTFKKGKMAVHVQEELDRLENQRKKKPKRRLVSLCEENNMSCENDLNSQTEPLQRTIGNPGPFEDNTEDVGKKHVNGGGQFVDSEQMEMHTKHILTHQDETTGILAEVKNSDSTVNDCKNYFNSAIADSGVRETCIQYIICNCLCEQENQQLQRKVIVLLSSEHKLYVLQRNLIFDGSGNDAYLVASLKIEDVTEVLVGLGLEVVRVCIDADAAYLLITESAEKSRQLLCMLEYFGSLGENNKYCLRSLERVQIDLFYNLICGGSETGIYQYSMVLFRQNNCEEGQWATRSLFVSGGLLFVCIEDILQFSSLSSDGAASNYYLLDSSCSITDVSKMVIEAGEMALSLTLESEQTEICLSAIWGISKFNTGFKRGKRAAKFRTWKLKWADEESLFKFVALVKAINVGVAISNLSITCVS